jgi:hypothetical protein
METCSAGSFGYYRWQRLPTTIVVIHYYNTKGKESLAVKRTIKPFTDTSMPLTDFLFLLQYLHDIFAG